MNYDYMIVGAGLSGMHMCLTAQKHGKSVLLVEDSSLPSSSKVAGGIFNPVTGKKLVKTWMADLLFENLVTYGELEALFGEKFVHHRTIYRPMINIQQQNDWGLKLGIDEYEKYLRANDNKHKALVHQEYGGIDTLQGGYIDIPTMLDGFGKWAKKHIHVLDECIEYNDLKITEDGILWKGHKIKQVIFCEGIKAKQNPFFDLPFNEAKGEVLEVKLPEYALDMIVNQGIAIVPLENGNYKIASTYEWKKLDWECTEEAREELLQKLKNIIVSDQIEVIEQKAGIRPSTKDRKPFVGTSTEHASIAILNGLGSKGVTIAPYFATKLFEHLEQDNPSKGLFKF